MQFSIIVPVYNVNDYLIRCVESIENQEYVDYEVILVDDGSTDKSSETCDSLKKKYSNIIVIHKQNGGLSDARNEGIKAAKGEYVLFVDGDDYIGEAALIEIEKVIRATNSPDIVCLELVKVFEGSTNIVKMGDGIDASINDLHNEEVYIYLANLPKYPASACTKAIKRKLFENFDLYFKKGLLSEDLEWSVRLFLAAKTFSYCPYQYYFYRQARKGSISNTPSEKKVMDILDTFQKWTEYSSSLEDNAQKNMIMSYMEYIFRFLVVGYENISKENRKVFLENVKKNSWILGTRSDLPSKCIKSCYQIFGINFTGKILKGYLKFRGY